MVPLFEEEEAYFFKRIKKKKKTLSRESKAEDEAPKR